MRNVLGLLPARGGSKGIPRKNVREVDGQPLLHYSVKAGREAEVVDRTVVSTEDEEIRQVARECGADVPFRRPTELATDDAPTEPVIEHALRYFKDAGTSYDTVVLLQPTSPLRTAAHVDEAFAQYRASDADSLVSVYADESYRWERGSDGASRKNYPEGRTRRQDKPPEFVENGAIYAADANSFLDTGDLQVGRTALFVMDRLTSVDVDEPEELKLAACLLEGRRTHDD